MAACAAPVMAPSRTPSAAAHASRRASWHSPLLPPRARRRRSPQKRASHTVCARCGSCDRRRTGASAAARPTRPPLERFERCRGCCGPSARRGHRVPYELLARVSDLGARGLCAWLPHASSQQPRHRARRAPRPGSSVQAGAHAAGRQACVVGTNPSLVHCGAPRVNHGGRGVGARALRPGCAAQPSQRLEAEVRACAVMLAPPTGLLQFHTSQSPNFPSGQPPSWQACLAML